MFFLLLYPKRFISTNGTNYETKIKNSLKQSLVRNFFIFERNNITRYHHKIVILSSSWNECSKLQPNKIYYFTI